MPTRKLAKPSLHAVAKLARGSQGKHTVPPGMQRLTVNVPEQLHLELKLLTVHRRTDMSAIVVRLLEDYVGAASK